MGNHILYSFFCFIRHGAKLLFKVWRKLKLNFNKIQTFCTQTCTRHKNPFPIADQAAPPVARCKGWQKISREGSNSPNYGKFLRSSSGSEDGLRFPGNLLAFSSVQRTVHPTQKPVELCEYLIRTYTRPGEVVADICAGSGTTAVAALNTGRRFVCFETAPAFYAPATERIRLATEAVKAGQKGV